MTHKNKKTQSASTKSNLDSQNDTEEENFWNLENEWLEDATDVNGNASEHDKADDKKTDLSPQSEVPEIDDDELVDELDIDDLDILEDVEADTEIPAKQEDHDDSAENELPTPTPKLYEGKTEEEDYTPPTRKPLSFVEKISLTCLAILFAGLAIYGYVWLNKKNSLSESEKPLKLPAKGQYATLTEFSTYWEKPNKSLGIRLGAILVPTARISLGEDSTSGALRIYFRDSEKIRVGDTVTVSFKNGQFENGKKTIRVSASDGFHMEGDFHAYQVDRSLVWTAHALEAKADTASGSDFQELYHTNVEPKYEDQSY